MSIENRTGIVTDSDIWINEGFVASYAFMERHLQGKRSLYECILEMIPDVEDEGSILLDIGSGLSTIEPAVSAIGYKYLGLDISRAMLSKANLGSVRVSNFQADVLTGIPLKDESVQIITATNFLYNFSRELIGGVIIPEMHRVLKSGGRIIVTNPIPNAQNLLILKEEWSLRGGGFKALINLAGQVFQHRSFLRDQGKLARNALKLDPEQWVRILEEKGFHSAITSMQAYAGQASIVSAQK